VYDALAQRVRRKSPLSEKSAALDLDELYRVRNIRPSFRGLLGRVGLLGDRHLRVPGQGAVTLHNHDDHSALKKAATAQDRLPQADGKLTFDKLGRYHIQREPRGKQRCHLTLKDAAVR